MNDDSSRRLISALCEPVTNFESSEKIEVLETHISWVLTTGAFAYKIRKPVNLGFADFSTLEKRRFYCEEELRLNRRLAPELYLDVIPISGTVESPELGGSGEPIEFAVKMRQFPGDSLLSDALRRDQVTPAHIDALARQIASFHRAAPVAGAEAPYGDPNRVLSPVQVNFERLLDSTADGPQRARIRSLQEWSLREYELRQENFVARKSGGFVRECHGDMHTGNMILWNDRATIFDCIDFNPDLRWIDVLSDVAFLQMDLEFRGHPEFAWRLLNGYLELTGDHQGLAVLRYYLVYRALVRAKVAAIRLRQGGLAEEEIRRNQEQLESYLRLADRYTQRRPAALIITHGLSGSGKSTGSQTLLENAGMIRIRSDVERKRAIDAERKRRIDVEPPEASGPKPKAGLYTTDAIESTYAQLKQLAEGILRSGFSVIVDATFLRRAQRDAFRGLAQGMKAPFLIVDFHAATETLRERVARRQAEGKDPSEANLEVLEQQIREQEAFQDDELASVITVDAAAPGAVETLPERVTTALRR